MARRLCGKRQRRRFKTDEAFNGAIGYVDLAYALLHCSLTQGQTLCASLGYAPLPAKTVRKEMRQIDSIH
ncbi:MAG TPA: hypothetical protein VGM43_20935 [Bryobacteraceae bacterium]|jgi:hypothetical protein